MGLFDALSPERMLARLALKALTEAAEIERMRRLPRGGMQQVTGVARGVRVLGRRWTLGLTLTAEDEPDR